MDYAAPAARAQAGGTDEEMLAWCHAQGHQPTPDEIEVWSEFMTERGWRDGRSEELAAAKRTRGFEARDDIQTWFDLHIAEKS